MMIKSIIGNTAHVARKTVAIGKKGDLMAVLLVVL